MGYRFAQMFLLILALVFAFAALDIMGEPWRTMNEAGVAETICSHLCGVLLSIFCFRAALYCGAKAAYGGRQRVRQPDL